MCSEILKCTFSLHNAGFTHLDIKPDNFIVNDDLTISFIDFGFMHDKNELVHSNVGTKGYLAPEIEHMSHSLGVSGEKVDVFALAITIRKILNCNNPLAN